MLGNQSDKQKNYYDALQGLRCIACLLVIADHCNVLGMGGHGGVAVCFFLTLSGFLLVMPWKKDGEERFLSASGIGQFYLRRVLRLLPAYYLLVLLHAFLSGQYDTLFGDLTFTNCSGHLWYIQQYVVILLIFPMFMILLALLKKLRLHNLLIAALLLAAAYLCRRYVTMGAFYLMGNGHKQRFRLPLFLVGMSAGYLWKEIHAFRARKMIAKAVLDLAAFAVIAASVLSGGRLLGMILPKYAGFEIAYAHDFGCAVASAVLILAVVANPDGLLPHFLTNSVMLLIGSLSYEIYLIHPMLMSFTLGVTASKLFLRVLILSTCAAYGLRKFLASSFHSKLLS